MSQHLDTLKICKRNNGRRFKKVFFQHRNNDTVPGKTALTTKTVKSTAFWLSVWKKWCIEKGIAKKIKITSRPSLTLCSSDSTPKLKTNMVKLANESDSGTDWTIPWTVKSDFELFCALKMWKYHYILLFWSYTVVLTECRILNKLFLHLLRALCFCIIMISYLVSFHACY